MCIIDYIRENSNWIKDISTVIFTGTATVLAILTFIRAKATILQPKRTEVTKKQTEIISNFLTQTSENGDSLDTGLDYINLLNYNVELALRDYGLIEIEKSSDKYKDYEQNIAGWIQFLDGDVFDYYFSKGSIVEYDKLIFEENDRARQKYYQSQAIKGKIEIHRIFYTKRHEKFYLKCKDFWNNPFLPKDIHDVAIEIGKNIHINIHYDLRTILKTLIKEYTQAKLDGKTPDEEIFTEKFRHQTLYRVFEKERKDHDKDFQILKERIRKHLRIDDKW